MSVSREPHNEATLKGLLLCAAWEGGGPFGPGNDREDTIAEIFATLYSCFLSRQRVGDSSDSSANESEIDRVLVACTRVSAHTTQRG